MDESDDCKLDELLALFDESDEDLSDAECIDHISSNKSDEDLSDVECVDNVSSNKWAEESTEQDSTPSHGGAGARKNSNESGTFSSSGKDCKVI